MAVCFRLADVLCASQNVTNKMAHEEDNTDSEILVMIFDEIQSHSRNIKVR